MNEREKFLATRFTPMSEYDWESKQVVSKAESLLLESSKLNIYKETARSDAAFQEWLSGLEL